jgi:hypothetical protein
MRGDLRDGRFAALGVFEDTIDADQIDESQLHCWMRVVNDARLVLGTKLDVTEDLDIAAVPDDDPNAPAYAIYSYLSMVMDQMVQVLLG